MQLIVNLGFQTLAYASVLYLVSVGLSVTLGLMGLINLAHSIFAMAGGYFAVVVCGKYGLPWYAALVTAPLVVALFAAAIERALYARLYGGDELDQVLFCIGLIFVAGALARILFGPLQMSIAVPEELTTVLRVGAFNFYSYKLFVIALGAFTAIAVLFGLERTRFGSMVRAAVENRGMAESVGLRTRWIFTSTFALGGALAAVGGLIGADLFAINPSYAFDTLVYVQIVVAVAGLGTLRGSFISSLLIGSIQTLSGYFFPEFGTILLFLAIFVLLFLRPQGLFGRPGVN
jgi:branched-chain amino acid transport system permease protein